MGESPKQWKPKTIQLGLAEPVRVREMDFYVCVEESGDDQSIPHEIIFDILSRLPVKSLSRFRCVSTLWDSTISDPYFVHSHFSHSLTRLHGLTLLLTFPNKFNTERLIFSATIPTNEPQSQPASHHLTLSGFVSPYVSPSLQGLICLDVGKHMRVCNPSTREFMTLPPTNTETPSSPAFTYFGTNCFGFDPISDEHKVLNTWIISTGDPEDEIIMEHRVFTVGSDEWRRIDDGPPHFPRGDGVCINGFIYYRSWTSMANPHNQVVVAFDVGGEEFHFISLPDDAVALGEDSVLMECEGHLAVVDYKGLRNGNNMEVWVLQDEQKQNWAKKSIVFPANWSDIKENRNFYLVGTIYTGEMIFAPRTLAKPFYVFCFDMKRNSVKRVEICGLPEYEFPFSEAYMNVSVTDHVENLLSLSELYY